MASEDSGTDALEFSDFWSNSGVDKEVLRGVKLRKEKSKHHEAKECKPVDISVHINTGFRNKGYKTSQGSSLSCCQSILSSTLSPFYNTKRSRKYKSKPHSCLKKSRKCPMRIAELAIPTKRQCLDTWRNKGKTLPNVMVDRLRQHVLDRKPVINVNDAINCFKYQRNKTRRTTKTKKSRNKDKNIDKAKIFCALFGHRITMKLLPSELIPVDRNLKNLSDVINEDVTQLLHIGTRIKAQNRDIQNEISDKVAVWIATVLEDSYMKIMLDDLQDLEEKEGHVWDIIDDLIEAVSEGGCKSDSILKYENQENASKKSSFISIYSNKSSPNSNITNDFTESLDNIQDISQITLQYDEKKTGIIDPILLNIINGVCINDTQPLEDFIKSVVVDALSEIIIDDNGINTNNSNDVTENSARQDDFEPKLVEKDGVIPINQIQSTIVTDQLARVIDDNHSEKSYKIKSEESFDAVNASTEKLINIEIKSNHYFDVEKDNQITVVNDTTSTAINNVEDVIIEDENINKNDKIDGDTSIAVEELSKEIKGFKHNPETPIDEEDNKDKLISAMMNTTEEQRYVNTDQNEHVESTTEVANENHNINIQPQIEEYNSQRNGNDESPDDSFKKVKFSGINIGNDRRIIMDANNQRYDHDNIILDKKLSSNSTRNYFKHINFSPPNTHLLCDMDESWPGDVLHLTSKLSASVSKSVTSLGFIKEADEKLITSPDTNQGIESSKQYLDETFLAELSNSCDGENTKDLHGALLLELHNFNINKTEEPKNDDFTCNHLITNDNGSASWSLTNSLEINDHEADIKVTKDANTSCISIKLKSIILPSVNIVSETLQKSFTKENQTQTEGAKPMDVVEQKRLKLKNKQFQISQQETRVWCKGLDNVILNLEKWLKWIEHTHSLVTQLRNNDVAANIKTQTKQDNLKRWMKLKESIDSDATLWLKLYKSLALGLNSYKNYYNHKNKKIKSPGPQGPCLCSKVI